MSTHFSSESNLSTDKTFLGFHVLLIEDVELNRIVLLDMLSDIGCTVMMAETAMEGLEKIDTEYFDAVLTDIGLPDKDGVFVIKNIRARLDEKALIPIIVVTGHTTPSDQMTYIESGANVVLTKPVTVKKLCITLLETISQKNKEIIW